jgi:RimJ/RimL family protein N-acetyltransferase
VRELRPPDPPLRDGDLLLRPSTPDDLPAILAVYSETDIQHWMGWDFDADGPTEDDIRGNIERAEQAWRDGTWAPFRIADPETDEVVGGVNLRFCDFDIAEISYFLRASARGRGFATRAVRLVVQWGFDELGLARIELRAHPENLPSQRVAERAGFVREGVERASRPWPSGERFDSILYSLLPADVG